MSKRRKPPPSTKPPKLSTPVSSSFSSSNSSPRALVRPKAPPPAIKPSKFVNNPSNYNRRPKTRNESGLGRENQYRTKKETQKVAMPSYSQQQADVKQPTPSRYNRPIPDVNQSQSSRYNQSLPNPPSINGRKGPPVSKPPRLTKKDPPLMKAHPKRPPPMLKPRPVSSGNTSIERVNRQPSPPITKSNSGSSSFFSNTSSQFLNGTPSSQAKYKKDDYVEYNSSNGWRRAVIDSVNPDGTYNILKDNGKIGQNWRENFLRPPPSAAPISSTPSIISGPTSVRKLSIGDRIKEQYVPRDVPKSTSTYSGSSGSSSMRRDVPFIPPRMIPPGQNVPIIPPRSSSSSGTRRDVPVIPPRISGSSNKKPPRITGRSFGTSNRNSSRENPEMAELRKWLASIKMEKYADQFNAQQYTNLATIGEMDDEDVREMIRDIGVKGGDKSIMRKEIKKLKVPQRNFSNPPPPVKSRSPSGTKTRTVGIRSLPPPPKARGLPPPPKSREFPPPPKARGLPPPSRRNVSSSPSNSSSTPNVSSQFGLSLNKKERTSDVQLAIEDTDSLVYNTMKKKVPESNCHVCNAKFNFTRTRYECIKCGHNVCNNCSPFKMKDTDWETGKMVMKRVCSDCSNPNKIRVQKYGS